METLVIEPTATGYRVYVMGSPRQCAAGVSQADALSNFLSEFHDYFVIVRDAPIAATVTVEGLPLSGHMAEAASGTEG